MLARAFFERDLFECAEGLIGCELVWGECSGIVVETEAYAMQGDEACHAFTRQSTRTFVEEHRPGAAYIYLNYGIHWLLNVLVKGGSTEGLILFRALQPAKGVALMQARRGGRRERDLCSGPGKLSEALGVLGIEHGIDLCAEARRSFEPTLRPAEVDVDLRIGISKAKHFPWRFLMKDSPYVSVRPQTPRAANDNRKADKKLKARPG